MAALVPGWESAEQFEQWLEKKLDNWLDQRLGKWLRFGLIGALLAAATSGVAYSSALGRIESVEEKSAPVAELKSDIARLQEKLESTEKRLDEVIAELREQRRRP